MDAVQVADIEMMLPLFLGLPALEARNILKQATVPFLGMPFALEMAKLVVFDPEVARLVRSYDTPDRILTTMLMHGDPRGLDDAEVWRRLMREHLAAKLETSPGAKDEVCRFLREMDAVFLAETFPTPTLVKMVRGGEYDCADLAGAECDFPTEVEPQIFEI
jgi:hypothetical protein